MLYTFFYTTKYTVSTLGWSDFRFLRNSKTL
jgi:hypothetical protein